MHKKRGTRMADMPRPDDTLASDAHRREMIRLAREVNVRAGIEGELTMTAKQLRESQRARGIRSEDNTGSRELLQMRHGNGKEKG
jgi:hypothetical protein